MPFQPTLQRKRERSPRIPFSHSCAIYAHLVYTNRAGQYPWVSEMETPVAEAAAIMARARRKDTPTTIRVGSKTKDLLDKLKESIAPDDTFDAFIGQLGELALGRLTPKQLSEMKHRAVKLDADEFDIDISDQLQPVIERLDGIEERLAGGAEGDVGGLFPHTDLPAKERFYSVGLLIGSPNHKNGEMYYALAFKHGVDPKRGGAWLAVALPGWFSEYELSEKAGNLPPRIAAAIRDEAKVKTVKKSD